MSKAKRSIRASNIDRSEVRNNIQRLWGDCLVREAKVAFKLFVKQEDIDSATPKQPGACVFARCFNRSCGTGKILFFKSVAYLEMPCEDGHTVVERYMVPKTMRDLIEDFDRNGGKNLKAGTGFTLRPPPKGRQLDHKAMKNRNRVTRKEENKRYNAKRKASLIGKRKAVLNIRSKYQIAEPIHMDVKGLEIRNGTGMVHFLSVK